MPVDLTNFARIAYFSFQMGGEVGSAAEGRVGAERGELGERGEALLHLPGFQAFVAHRPGLGDMAAKFNPAQTDTN